MTDPRVAGIRTLSYYMPLGRGSCGGCSEPIVYNMTIQVIEHEEPNPDCPRAWVKVVRTPEEEARIATAEAEAVARDEANRERHAHLLRISDHPVLTALVEAHGPASADRYPVCVACPAPPSEYDGDPQPTDWPCPVWVFISDRMEKP